MRFTDRLAGPRGTRNHLRSATRAVALGTAACIAAPALLAAQTPAPASSSTGPAVHPLRPITRASTPQFRSIASVRPLSTGGVLVNDMSGREVVMLDSTLANPIVVADSTGATANAYSSRLGSLIPYRADSTVFVDPSSLSMLMIDPHGKVGRVMAVPKASDAAFLIGGPFGWPGFDPSGHLVYRAMLRPKIPTTFGAGGNGRITIPAMPDSAPLIRFDMDARRADTLAYVHTIAPRVSGTMVNGRMNMTMTVNPMPVVDDWALLPDGTVALLHGREYRVEFLKPDGSRVRGPVIPFPWEHLTDADKQRVLDSAKTAMETARSRVIAMTTSSTSGTKPAVAVGGSDAAMVGAVAGGATVVVRTRDGDGSGPPARGPANGNAQNAPNLPDIETVPASELPDYRPAFTSGALRADADGNLWIRTTRTANGGPVYDVLNSSGALIDRVQLPAGRTIAGFGPGGVVYLAVRDGTKGARLEEARVR